MSDDRPNGILRPPEAPKSELKACLTILFDPATGNFGHRMEPGAPVPGLVNHLEIVKAQLVMNQLMHMQQVGARQGLLMPDGSPAPPH